MKSPLSYQATMFDCGKTSFVDALMYLFEREEIPPQVIDYVTRVTGDCNIGVNGYMRGTSGRARLPGQGRTAYSLPGAGGR